MNKKNIAKALKAKLTDWLDSIDDLEVKKVIEKNAIVTGGALVSLLTNEPINDYDIYFKTYESCKIVAQYYMDKWNDLHPSKSHVRLDDNSDVNQRVMLVIGFGRGNGVVEEGNTMIDDESEPVLEPHPYTTENEDNPTEQHPEVTTPKYRPRYFTTNALSLSDKIQIILRFTGSVDELHKNFDFTHTKCSYDFSTNNVNLPAESLECIINKELRYNGSKYPLTSIIRTRKFISRGWTINAGQYVKMVFELNELNLKDLSVFKDQVVGVDSAYFIAALDAIMKKKVNNPDFELNAPYLFEVIDKIF